LFKKTDFYLISPYLIFVTFCQKIKVWIKRGWLPQEGVRCELVSKLARDLEAGKKRRPGQSERALSEFLQH
jgi:hypothetical protein